MEISVKSGSIGWQAKVEQISPAPLMTRLQ